MDINLLLDIIEKNLPRETAMDGDRIGLQVQAGDTDLHNLLITMEVNDAVIDEAIKLKSDCIITFHPLIFHPVLQITEEERVGKLLLKLIRNSISLIAIHTNFDSYINGTSKILCDKLNLEYQSFLVPDKTREGYGMGVICTPKSDLQLNQLLENISSVSNAPLRYCEGKPDSSIKKIAIVGGSGSSFIDDALNSNVDSFITADVSYHNFHKVKGKMALIDPGHYEMEQFVAKGLYDFLSVKIDKNIILNLSHSYTNPVRYFPDNSFNDKQKKYIINKY